MKKDKLIEGRFPNIYIYISKGISKIINDKVSYTKKSGFNDQYYKDLVLKYLDNFEMINKKELDELLMGKLSENLTLTQKKNKIFGK